MNYTLNQLRIFLKIVQTESITKASEELHLTQPAVSIQLKNFQQQFEIPLTEVIGKKLFITDFGREIAQAADSILNEVYAINYKAMAYKGHLTGRLKISVVSTGKYVIPYFLTAFLKKNPNIELHLDFSNKARVIENLEKNEVDFSLVSVLPESLRLKHTKLMQNKLFLVGNLDQKFGDKTIDKSTLEGMTLIYREEGSATRTSMEKFVSSNNVHSKTKLELTTNEAIKQSVVAGLGHSIMPLIGIKNELMNGQLQIIPAKGLPICTDWNLVWLADKKLSPVANAFLEYIEKEKNAIINEHFSWYEAY
jgi:DNA-binding transcriptional LysR family regulator